MKIKLDSGAGELFAFDGIGGEYVPKEKQEEILAVQAEFLRKFIEINGLEAGIAIYNQNLRKAGLKYFTAVYDERTREVKLIASKDAPQTFNVPQTFASPATPFRFRCDEVK